MFHLSVVSLSRSSFFFFFLLVSAALLTPAQGGGGGGGETCKRSTAGGNSTPGEGGGGVGGGILSAEKNLLTDLLCDYNPAVRPVRNASSTVSVVISSVLLKISNLNEKAGILTTNNWLKQVWMDEQLTWNESLYNRVSLITIPIDKIWNPNIILMNNAGETDTFVADRLVQVRSDGQVTWVTHMRLHSFCDLDLALFPYDTQNCSQVHGSWTYDKELVNVQLAGNSNRQYYYRPQGEWEVVDYSAQLHDYSDNVKQYGAVVYMVSLKRVTVYYRYMLVYPTLLLTTLTLMLFLMSPEGSQRIMLASGILVSIVLLLVLLETYLPTDLGRLPVIASYLMFNFVFLVVTIGVTILCGSLQSRDKTSPLPNWVRQIFLGPVSRLLCIKHPGYTPLTLKFTLEENDAQRELQAHFPSDSPSDPPQSTRGPGSSLALDKTLEEIRCYLRVLAAKANQTERVPDHSQLVTSEWKLLSQVLDRLFFCFFFFIAMLVTIGMYAHS